jgi:hypothetical protein
VGPCGPNDKELEFLIRGDQMSPGCDTIDQTVKKYGKLLRVSKSVPFVGHLKWVKDVCHFLDDCGFCPKEIGGVIPKLCVLIVDAPTM